MPFVTREEGDRLRAQGVQVVRLPVAPPDGLVHYASTKHHLMCHPVSMDVQTGSPMWSKVTCPQCLRMGKRTERLNKDGTVKPVVRDTGKPRNQDEGAPDGGSI